MGWDAGSIGNPLGGLPLVVISTAMIINSLVHGN